MPNRDKTGPLGNGPLTGRGLGGCKGEVKNTENRPLVKNLGRGRGRDKGLGLGRGINK